MTKPGRSQIEIAAQLLLQGDIDALWRKGLSRLTGLPVALPATLKPLPRPAGISTHAGKDGSAPRIWMVGSSLNRDGAPLSQLELAVGLAGLPYTLEVLSPVDGPLRAKYAAAGIAVRIVPELRCSPAVYSWYEDDVASLRAKIDAGQPDLIFASTIDNFAVIDAARMAGVPTIWNIRESEAWPIRLADRHTKIARRALACLGYSEALVFVADAARRAWSGFAPSQRSHVIYNAPSPALIEAASSVKDNAGVRRDLGAQPGDTLIVHVGTICERKGQVDLASALANLPEETLHKLRIAFIGGGEGDYPDRVRAALGPAVSRTIFAGESETAAAQIAAADILVNTSRSEAFPRTFIEAGIGHTAIIATEIDGTTERLKDQTSALLYTAGDAASLTRHLAALAEAPQDIARLADGAHDALVRSWTYADMLSAYARQIDEALVEHARAVQ
ncbi:MAG: glycosyltransferase [Burkholderiales bacterium]|nr:MAG: glycosyltransferase [Burkholderiales bacterium]